MENLSLVSIIKESEELLLNSPRDDIDETILKVVDEIFENPQSDTTFTDEQKEMLKSTNKDDRMEKMRDVFNTPSPNNYDNVMNENEKKCRKEMLDIYLNSFRKRRPNNKLLLEILPSIDTPKFSFIGLTYNKSLIATIHYNEIYNILHHFDDILFDVDKVYSRYGSWKISFRNEIDQVTRVD